MSEANTYVVPELPEVDGPTTGADREILRGYLRYQRRSLLNICAGLSPDQLAERTIPSTDLTLLGLVRHLAKVERIWFRERFAGEDIAPLYGGAGHTDDFTDIDAATAQDAVGTLQREWAACDAVIDRLPADAEISWRGQILSLGAILVHVLIEYARHNGHADLIREAQDGVVGR